MEKGFHFYKQLVINNLSLKHYNMNSSVFYLLFCAFYLCAIGLWAQPQHLVAEQVPAAVKLGFSKKYPKTTDMIWQREENGLYSAQFWDDMNDVYVNVYLEEDGTWSRSVMEVTPQAFTEAIRQYMKNNYPDISIASVFSTQEPGGRATYKILLEEEDKLITLFLDRSANLLNKTEETINFETHKD